jgi:hypothetical protein
LLKLTENGAGAAAVEVAFKSGKAAIVQFRITTGEPILTVQPGEGACALDLLTKARHVVLPEFFADDLVFASERACLPVENCWLHCIEGGDAIVMCVSQAPLPVVWLGTAGTLNDKFSAANIECASGKSIWLAFLEGQGLWHSRAASEKDDWKPPFAARWRCSVAGKDGMAVSSDYERGPAPGQVPGEGPAIIYPLDRTKATPLTAICPIDVMRYTLGVGPCQYVLQAEGLASEANPTPEQVTHWVEQQFKRKKEEAAAAVRERLGLMAQHVGRVQERIRQYGDAAKQMRQLCTGASERLVGIVESLERASGLEGDAAKAPETIRRLAEAIGVLIGKPDALAECQKLGEQIRAIGAAQDTSLARCRLAVRRLLAECRTGEPTELTRKLEDQATKMLRGDKGRVTRDP